MHRLLHLIVTKLILLNEGSKQSIKAIERNGAHNLVLEDRNEIGTLVQDGVEVLCGCGSRNIGDSSYTLIENILEGITRAIQGQTAEVVQMNISIYVSSCDMFGVNLTKPIVFADFCNHIFGQTTVVIDGTRIFFYSPVATFKVGLNDVLAALHF